MKISCNWLKRYIDFNGTPKELENVLTMMGVEVESIDDLGKKYANFYICEVTHKTKHPNADKLSVCEVNRGDVRFQIVCGASNVAVGQKVVVGMVGAVVPANELLLEKRDLRGVQSNGMICSQAELLLGEDGDGIWVLPEDAKIGQSLADYLDIRDIILDISLTPNKVDCASHKGIAREIAAAKGINIKGLKSRGRQRSDIQSFIDFKSTIKNFVDVNYVNNALCPRYTIRVVTGVKNAESPQWLKQSLLKVGLRPINIVVDVTNFVLMDIGQPLHAFDLDKLSKNEKNIPEINVRNGFNTNFTTLDRKERSITEDMAMICDAVQPIAIAGVMGGKNCEIDMETTNVVLESACFSPSSIRKTAKRLNLQTDASYRFERGSDIDATIEAVNMAAKMIALLTGGKVLNEFVDVYPKVVKKRKIVVHTDKVTRIIGKELTRKEIRGIFKTLDFEVEKDGVDSLVIVVPNRRVDVEDEIDLIEEIARVINYDNIDNQFASRINFQRSTIPVTLKPISLRNTMRKYLSARGFIELLTQNIVSPNDANIITDKHITIANPLGVEMSVMRPDMLPSILKVISYNIRQGNTNLQLFETGKCFLAQNNIQNSFIEGIDEREQIIVAITGKVAPRQWGYSDRDYDFFDIKGSAEELLEYIRIPKLKFKQPKKESNLFDINSIDIYSDKIKIGTLGQIKNSVLKKYDIDAPVFAMSCDMTTMSELDITLPQFKPFSVFPAVKRDLAFVVDEKWTATELQRTIKGKASDLLKSVSIFDLYKGKGIDNGEKSIGFELTLLSDERTLTDVEIESEISNIVQAMETEFSAVLRTT